MARVGVIISLLAFPILSTTTLVTAGPLSSQREAIRAATCQASAHDCRQGALSTWSGDDVAGTKREEADSDGPLVCFQVTSPVESPQGPLDNGRVLGAANRGAQKCENGEVVLMKHVFGNSFGQPYVGDYAPPTNCDFNRVIISFTVTSNGTQFDRLATFSLGDVELWRTSTAEPKPDPGIIWTYNKDVTNYLALWKQPQKVIFDLGNLVNDVYTGYWDTTLTATFFKEDLRSNSNAEPADQILPISARRGSQGKPSAWNFPGSAASTDLTLPRNVERAVVAIGATGQGAEEFWWGNVPESLKHAFQSEAGDLPGLSSFREVRLMIDGQIAGLAWPFPVIFTGGIAPPLHRPLVGLQAFDLRENEIDITPWLGVLSDGKPHKFGLAVVGVDDSGDEAVFATVPASWILSGKVFLWLGDQRGDNAGGPAPQVQINNNNFWHLSSNVASLGRTGRLDYQQNVQRQISVRSSGFRNAQSLPSQWQQSSQMLSSGVLADGTDYQLVNASYSGRDLARSGDNGDVRYQSDYTYPLYSESTYKVPDGDYAYSQSTDLTQGFHCSVTGLSVFPNGLEPYLHGSARGGTHGGSLVNATRQGSAFVYQLNDKTSGFGSMMEDYSLSEQQQQQRGELLYSRKVKEVNETIQYDQESSRGVGQFDHGRGPPTRGRWGVYAPGRPRFSHGRWGDAGGGRP